MSRRFLTALGILLAAQSASAAEARKVTLDVKGMTCATCPLTVKVVLGKQPGVQQVKVDSIANTAEVTFDSARTSPQRLASAVTEAGYPAKPRP